MVLKLSIVFLLLGRTMKKAIKQMPIRRMFGSSSERSLVGWKWWRVHVSQLPRSLGVQGICEPIFFSILHRAFN